MSQTAPCETGSRGTPATLQVLWLACLLGLTHATGASAQTGVSYAKAVGAYAIGDGETCRFSEEQGQLVQDVQFVHVCLPRAKSLEIGSTTLALAIAELTDPDLFAALLSKVERGDVEPDTAFRIEIEATNGDVFDLADGTLVRTTGAPALGAVGQSAEAILYSVAGIWTMCVGGNRFEVELLRDPQRTGERSRISTTVAAIEADPLCRA